MKTIKIEFRSNGYLTLLTAKVDLRCLNSEYFVLAISDPFENMTFSLCRFNSPMYELASSLPQKITLSAWNDFLKRLAEFKRSTDNSDVFNYFPSLSK